MPSPGNDFANFLGNMIGVDTTVPADGSVPAPGLYSPAKSSDPIADAWYARTHGGAARPNSGAASWEDIFRKQYEDSLKAQPVGLDSTQNDQSRQLQQAQIQDLHRLALGDPNSTAQQQLAASSSQARGASGTLAAARRDVGAGAAQRGAAVAQSGLQQQQAQMQKILMLQEQQAAQAELAKALMGQRGQDMSFANANAQNQLQTRANADDMTATYGGLLGNAASGNINSTLDFYRANLGLDAANRAQTRDDFNAIRNGIGTGVSTIASMYGGPPESSQSKIDRAFNEG